MLPESFSREFRLVGSLVTDGGMVVLTSAAVDPLSATVDPLSVYCPFVAVAGFGSPACGRLRRCAWSNLKLQLSKMARVMPSCIPPNEDRFLQEPARMLKIVAPKALWIYPTPEVRCA